MQPQRHRRWSFFLSWALFGLAGCHQANLIESPLFLPGREAEDKKAALKRPDGEVQQTAATEVNSQLSKNTSVVSARLIACLPRS